MEPGARLGPYEIVARLGAGGMGEVWRARDTRLERDVALKVLPASTTGDEVARARLVREARLASKLNHPNVCTIFDVGEADGQVFVTMELVEGQTLADRLAKSPMPADEVLRLAQQLADALAHAHEHGVVHRDFKSANVILTPEGRTKVLDFGLAKKLSLKEAEDATTLSRATLTEAGTVAGTPAYMAPEQLRGEPADVRSDVWALGVVLYEMATRRRPFQGKTGFELTSAILKEPPEPLPTSVPTPLRSVIERCLAKDPSQRFRSGSEVRAVLESLQSGREPVAWSPRRRAAWRRPVVAAVAALVVTLAVLVAANTFGLRSRLLGGGAMPGIDSLAVLPLENLSGDAGQAYLADGIHDALITDLSRLSGLKRVVARGSVLRFKGTTAALRTVADELKVAGLITGAVLRSGDRVRVTAQLINPATEAQVWANSYERPMKDILSLENEIVTAITREVRLRLTAEEKTRLSRARTVNPEVYDAYLMGMAELWKKTPAGFEKGMSILQRATYLDPTDPLPFAGLALAYPIIYHGMAASGFVPPREGFPRARAAALKALELDGNSPHAHLALAAVKTYFDWDWAGGEREFKRALELNPNFAEARLHYGGYLYLFKRNEEAMAELKKAAELDPLTAEYAANVGWLYWILGQLDEAVAEARKALELDPKSVDAHFVLSGAYCGKKMYDEALAADRKLIELNPSWKFSMAGTFVEAGRRDEALKLIAEMEREDYPRYALWLFGFRAQLGDREEAFRALDAAFEYRHIFLPWNMQLGDADFPWRTDPRWQAYMRRMNFPGK
ncbi:MAG TPA: protein kinase [Thermoanaerobaculia bacterium]|nr:protein kinase [Thermoanaerobaculia bacterium]